VVLECENAGSVRVVEASLAPLQRLAPKPAVQDPLWKDYSKLLGDTELADVMFAVDGQRL